MGAYSLCGRRKERAAFSHQLLQPWQPPFGLLAYGASTEGIFPERGNEVKVGVIQRPLRLRLSPYWRVPSSDEGDVDKMSTSEYFAARSTLRRAETGEDRAEFFLPQ